MVARSRALKHLLFVAALLFLFAVSLQTHALNIQHQIKVELQPSLSLLKATDRVRLPIDSPKKISFLLNKNFSIQSIDSYSKIILINPGTAETEFSEWGIELTHNEFTVEYSGKLDTPVSQEQSHGIINLDGAFLSGATYWYPNFSGGLQTFEVSASIPANWSSLTQGQRTSSLNQGGANITSWSGIYPQQEIYLVAGPYVEFSKSLGNGKNIRILLRKSDNDLAQKFLNLIPGYIDHYSNEIANYPYSDFTVVENLWETGLGMPAFTLLGPSVIRLPFILNTSLPHEILHNWWGNGVYVDYSTGNWSEGLTTYMADHWQQKVLEQDADYRLSTLVNYADYVKSEKDFPIRKFISRYDPSSQAVGYGKTMMFFHMLEIQHGEAAFKKSLQAFYAEKHFQVASFTDIQNNFEKIIGKNLQSEFTQWLDRTGAPTIELSEVTVSNWSDGSFHVNFTLKQNQTDLYELTIPVLLTLANGKTISKLTKLKMRSQNFNFLSVVKPVKIDVDPEYNIFRTLYREERSATLSAALGSAKVHFYFPQNIAGAHDFARTWQEAIAGKTEIHPLTGNLNLAAQGSIVLIGDDSRFSQYMKQLLVDQDFDIQTDALRIQSNLFSATDHSWMVVARNRSNPDQIIVWVRWAHPINPTEWARRLTHYGKFGALVFKEKPNVLKITWPVNTSPLRRSL